MELFKLILALLIFSLVESGILNFKLFWLPSGVKGVSSILVPLFIFIKLLGLLLTIFFDEILLIYGFLFCGG